MIDFLENKLVTQHILVEVSSNAIDTRVRSRERLPQLPFAVLFGNDDRSATRIIRIVPNLVLGVVRKQRTVAIRSPGRQTAPRRDEHPVVGIANDTDEEIIHAIDISDAVIRLTITSDVVTLHGSGRSNKGIVTQIQRFVSHISQSLIS